MPVKEGNKMNWKHWLCVAVSGAIPFGIYWLSGAPFVRGKGMAETGFISIVCMLAALFIVIQAIVTTELYSREKEEENK
jgi:hypothetical protein